MFLWKDEKDPTFEKLPFGPYGLNFIAKRAILHGIRLKWTGAHSRETHVRF